MDMFRERMPDSWIYPASYRRSSSSCSGAAQVPARQARDEHLFVLMDDCMYDKKVLKSTAMRDLFMNGRHPS